MTRLELTNHYRKKVNSAIARNIPRVAIARKIAKEQSIGVWAADDIIGLILADKLHGESSAIG